MPISSDTPDERAEPEPLDFETPSPARVYACYLGAYKGATRADRAAAERVIAAAPNAPQVARQNYLFAGRGAAHFAGVHRIGQVIDIGVGLVDDLPPELRTIESRVQAANPDARVVAVDNDPVVLAHARGLRPGYGGVLQGDITDPDGVLDHLQARGLLEVTEPAVLVLAAVLHFLNDPAAVTARLAARLAPGSVLVLSHATSTATPDDTVEEMTGAYEPSPSGIYFRSEEQIRSLVEGNGWELLDPPGLAEVGDWAPGGETVAPWEVDAAAAVAPPENAEGARVRVVGMAAVLGGRR